MPWLESISVWKIGIASAGLLPWMTHVLGALVSTSVTDMSKKSRVMVTSSSGVSFTLKRLMSIMRKANGNSRRRSSSTTFNASACEEAVNAVAVPVRKRAWRSGVNTFKASYHWPNRTIHSLRIGTLFLLKKMHRYKKTAHEMCQSTVCKQPEPAIYSARPRKGG